MAKLTKDQRKFWDVLSNPYPHHDIRRCLNCIYYGEDRAPSLKPRCSEPEYVKIDKARSTCGTSLNYIKWKWNGKVYSKEEWSRGNRDT